MEKIVEKEIFGVKVKEMNKLKALLITVSLLSLSSVSFATSVTYSADYISGFGSVADGAQSGSITIDDDGLSAVFGGRMGAGTGTATTASTWYELILTGNDLTTFGWADNTLQPSDLTTTFQTADGSANISQAFLGNFSISLMAGTYRMLLSGAENRSYDGEISAVPVPAAGILFASALLGAGIFGRRKKKSATSVMVGAFTRES